MAVETSLVIQFQDEAAADAASSGTVVAELDPEHANNLDSDGNLKSTFDVSDQPVFLIHHDDTLSISSVDASTGDVSSIGSNVSRQKDISVQFTSADSTESISYDGATLASVDWYGTGCTFSIDGTELTPNAGGNFPCIGEAVFNVNFNAQYKLIPPTLSLEEDEEYKILIVVTMAAV